MHHVAGAIQIRELSNKTRRTRGIVNAMQGISVHDYSFKKKDKVFGDADPEDEHQLFACNPVIWRC